MATRVKIKWKRGVFKEIRTLPDVMSIVESTADSMAADAGEGYEATAASVTRGRGRARASVVTATPRAMHDNAKRHTLTRVLAQGGSSGA